MSHKLTSANPMSESRRHQVHGPLQPSDAARRDRLHGLALAWIVGVTGGVVVYILGSM